MNTHSAPRLRRAKSRPLTTAPNQVSPPPLQSGGELVSRLLVSGAIILITSWSDRARPPEPRPPMPPWARLHDDTPVVPYGPGPRDWGGRLDAYILKVGDANRRRARVEIRGTCVSACTLFLGVNDVCVDGGAMLWFHAAYHPTTRRIDAGATRAMALYWGPKIAAWAKSVGATESLEFTRRRALSGEEAIRLGVRRCPDVAATAAR